MELVENVKRHADRVSVSFGDKDVSDHDWLVTVTFDLKKVQGMTDAQLIEEARLILKRMV